MEKRPPATLAQRPGLRVIRHGRICCSSTVDYVIRLMRPSRRAYSNAACQSCRSATQQREWMRPKHLTRGPLPASNDVTDGVLGQRMHSARYEPSEADTFLRTAG